MANKLIQLTDGGDNVFPKITFGYVDIFHAGTLQLPSNTGTLRINDYFPNIPSNAIACSIVTLGGASGGFNVSFNASNKAMYLIGNPNVAVSDVTLRFFYITN